VDSNSSSWLHVVSVVLEPLWSPPPIIAVLALVQNVPMHWVAQYRIVSRAGRAVLLPGKQGACAAGGADGEAVGKFGLHDSPGY
jgi:hypothetical protein